MKIMKIMKIMLEKSFLETRLNCFKHIRFKYLIPVLLLCLVGLQSIVAQTIINGDFERGFIDPFYSKEKGWDKVFVVHKDHARVDGGINSTIKEGIGGNYVLEALDVNDYQSLRTQLDHLVVGEEYKLRFRFAVDDRKSSFDNSHEIFVDIITHTSGTIIEQVKYNAYTTNRWRNAEITFTATQAYHILSIFIGELLMHICTLMTSPLRKQTEVLLQRFVPLVMENRTIMCFLMKEDLW